MKAGGGGWQWVVVLIPNANNSMGVGMFDRTVPISSPNEINQAGTVQTELTTGMFSFLPYIPNAMTMQVCMWTRSAIEYRG